MADHLAHLLDQQRQAGIFTHVYASCGLLHEQQPRYTFAHLPASQNIFDLASLTKALVTLPLYINATIVDKLQLNTPLGTLLDDSEHKLCDTLARLHIADLLCHRSGLPAWRNLWIGTLGTDHTLSSAEVIAMLNRCATAQHDIHLNKTQPLYSDLNFILAGICWEIFQKKPLDVLFAEFCRTVLKFTPNTCFNFHPPQDKAIPSAYCHIRQRLLQGEAHDENCAACGGVSGHAGLFGNGDNLVTYLRCLFTHAVGQTILRHNQAMLTHAPNPLPLSAAHDSLPLSAAHDSLPLSRSACLFGLQRGANGVLSSSGALLGHLGFTGTSFWLNPAQNSYTVLLTNRTINARLVPQFHNIRQQAFTALQEKLANNW